MPLFKADLTTTQGSIDAYTDAKTMLDAVTKLQKYATSKKATLNYVCVVEGAVSV